MSVTSSNVETAPTGPGEAGGAAIPIASSAGQRVIDALHGLEHAAARPGWRRETAWAADLRLAADRIEKALAILHHHSSSADALLPQLVNGDPSAREVVAELREQYRRIAGEVRCLGQHLESVVVDDRVDPSDVRHRVERIGEEIRYQRAREADLVYEAAGSMPAPWTEPHTGHDVALDELVLTSRERVRLMERQLDVNRTIVTDYGVERAAGAPASGRVERWGQDLAAALGALENAMSLERSNGNRAGSMLTEMSRADPLVRSEIQTERARYDQAREAVALLRGEILHHIERDTDCADLRWRVASLLSTVRHEQARQGDFLYRFLS
jgi:hypothetical protein